MNYERINRDNQAKKQIACGINEGLLSACVYAERFGFFEWKCRTFCNKN